MREMLEMGLDVLMNRFKHRKKKKKEADIGE